MVDACTTKSALQINSIKVEENNASSVTTYKKRQTNKQTTLTTVTLPLSSRKKSTNKSITKN
jgi:hypothetical protein